MYKIAKENLSALFSKIAETKEIFLPIKTASQTNFGLWTEDSEVDLDTLKTVKSPKDVFFPQSENLYKCITDNKDIKIEPEALKARDFVVFGVKGCDLKGVEVLDKVFLSEPVDTFYKARRDHGIIVALACGEPEESCFCTTFGVDPTNPTGIADITAWNVGDSIYMTPITDKGEVLIASVADILETTDDSAVEEQKSQISSILSQLPYSDLSLDGWGGDVLDEKFNSPLWEELYKPCLACGTCTFVCPTCQCYDIKDYDTGHGVQRYRCWDSCMYSDFTMMAHGNNRTSQMQRFRQRFMHKLVYFPANNDGMFSCVGCGRCVDKCPSSLNIVKVIKAFNKEGK